MEKVSDEVMEKRRQAVKKFRAKEKLLLGEDALKNKRRLAKQVYRKKTAVKPLEFKNYEAFSLYFHTEHSKHRVSIGKEPATKKTIDMYVKTLKTLYTLKHPGAMMKLTGWDWINDVEAFLSLLNRYKLGTRAKYLMILNSAARVLKLSSTDIYTTLNKSLTEERQEAKDSNAYASPEQEAKMRENTWFDVVDTLRGFDIYNDTDGRGLLIKLLAFMPLRRTSDYRLLKFYVIGRSKPPMDLQFNHIVIGKTGKPREIIYNVYKTSKIYGQQTYKIPSEVQDYINHDIPTPHHGKKVFTNNTFNVLTTSQMTGLIRSTTGTALGTELTMNDLRHIYFTDICSRNYSVAKTTKMAVASGSSFNEIHAYKRGVNDDD